MTCIAVLGLGEAGSAIVADLLTAGVRVRGYDPDPAAMSSPPDGVVPCGDEADAARGADAVLSVNSSAAALDALRAGMAGTGKDALWADLNTAAPQTERDLAAVAQAGGITFADVSLMAPVPGKGVRTPMLASGDGAARFADLLRPFGAEVEVLDLPAGEAAQRKLLRSVFFKGMAAAVTEALEAAGAVGRQDWMRTLIAAEFEQADAAFARRLELGSIQHAVRRREEMIAATELLTDLGVPPRIASASRDWLADLAARTAEPLGSEETEQGR
jgi:3-hydroxyisobutyrate dehydrogenase-like beta-hydroxyacid dehydrogenase